MGGSDNPKDPRKWGPRQFGWNSKPMQTNGLSDPIIKLAKDQEFYKPIDITIKPSRWFDWSISRYAHVLWYAGLAIVTIGVGYLCYTLYMDPSIIKGVWPIKPLLDKHNNPGVNVQPPSPTPLTAF